jgi:hypothetical protein
MVAPENGKGRFRLAGFKAGLRDVYGLLAILGPSDVYGFRANEYGAVTV